ncbi:Hypothetical protein R9X50_00205500 [Acrodontium crateriforme]|uniref:DNA polymerase alpha subunit B n=1 Tax=Acrodontium crateriforme TaxID=150365 RepID=A0AAQ3M0F8_9PEZI|nr:Hypothetical protein R9X50_00205500 [Acrodontium crateriforme]
MADLEASLNERFAPHGAALPADVITELLHMIRLFSIDTQDLFYKWESYVQKMGVENTQLDLKTAREFKRDIQEALERESRTKGRVVHSASKKTAATPRAGAEGDVFDMIDGMTSVTPGRRIANAAKRKAMEFDTPGPKSTKMAMTGSPADNKTPSQAIAFEHRQNAGLVTEQLNSHLAAASVPLEPPEAARVKLKANTELPKFAYKGMAMKLSESSEILDDRIDTFTDIIQSHHEIPDIAFGNPAAQSTAEIVAVGRIACDQPNGKLNSASLVLETSRRMGAGMRVPLKLDGVGYDLFPGKVVALRGSNVSGEYFAVTEVLSMPLVPLAASTPDELDVHTARLTGNDDETRPLSMLLGSGPFTTDSDLSFAPLHALLNKAEEEKTDVLILTGPFLDLEHPAIASGDLEQYLPADTKIHVDRATIQDVFRVLISQPLQRLAQAVPSITIIMVPGMRDAINKHTSWPQDRFPKQPLGLPKNVQVVTNPITLSINEMIVGISTQDILSELRRENVFQPGKSHAFNDDLLARLSASVIEQRHFFPVFPAQARENLPKPTTIPGEIPEPGSVGRLAVGASLDLGYLKLGEWLNVRPDILILPTVLNPFAKVVESVLCVNPGTLSKKRGAGTFAALNIHPRQVSDAEREEGAAVAHNVFQRARVDVARI